MGHIFIVDDSKSYCDKIKKILEAEGYSVDSAYDPMEAIVKIAQKKCDLLITDLNMDNVNGIQLVNTLKKLHPKMKTIILTGFPTVETELEALDNYVDGYLQKDINTQLFLKYVETTLTRDKKVTEGIFYSKAENIECNITSRTLRQHGEEVALSKKEFDILAYFLEHKNQVIAREDLLNEFWDFAYELVDERIIDVHVKELRKKLNLISISTIRGIGYKWSE